MKKKLSARKIIIIGIIAVFLIAVIARTVMVITLNRRFNSDMTYHMDPNYLPEYEYYEDGYYYYYSPAYIFNMDCFARLCTLDSMKLNLTDSGETTTNGMSITLFIWPHWDKSYEMGVLMEQYDAEHSINVQFYIDSELNYIARPGDEDGMNEEKQLLEEYYNEIEELVNRAKTKWDTL